MPTSSLASVATGQLTTHSPAKEASPCIGGVVSAGLNLLLFRVQSQSTSDVAPDTMLTESWWPRVREPTELGTYFILHKPRDVLTSRDDSTGRATVYDCVSEAGFAPVGHVGRLDYETTGLLLFTDDSQLNLAIRDPVFKGLATIPGCPSTSMRKVRR